MPAARRRLADGWFVLVAGWPGSGKSTLAAALAAELGLPLLAKDEIKEALMEGLGRPETVAASQRLGQAAVRPVTSMRPAATKSSGASRPVLRGSARLSRSTPPVQWTWPGSPPPWLTCSPAPEAAAGS